MQMHEYEYWKKASSTINTGNNLREMWFNEEAGAPPQRQEPIKQQSPEHLCPVLEVPSPGACEDQSCNMLGVSNGIHPKENSEVHIMRKRGMHEAAREKLSRVAMGTKNRTYRLKAIGNGQVPAVVRLAWETLSQGMI